jgi:hypothetical protein
VAATGTGSPAAASGVPGRVCCRAATRTVRLGVCCRAATRTVRPGRKPPVTHVLLPRIAAAGGPDGAGWTLTAAQGLA